MYDIGFQALSRMVASGADIKVLVLVPNDPNTPDDDTFLMKNRKSGKCVDLGTQAGANALQWDCHGATHQQFTPYQLRD